MVNVPKARNTYCAKCNKHGKFKVSKKTIRKNSHDEKMAMNEVFAHAALMKHKHVVRYYNSWVENGAIYIQNEYCEGGSLQKKIEDYRASGLRFSEAELSK